MEQFSQSVRRGACDAGHQVQRPPLLWLIPAQPGGDMSVRIKPREPGRCAYVAPEAVLEGRCGSRSVEEKISLRSRRVGQPPENRECHVLEVETDLIACQESA